MQDLGLHGVESCRCQRYRYQTPHNLLIYRNPFGTYERVTDYGRDYLGRQLTMGVWILIMGTAYPNPRGVG